MVDVGIGSELPDSYSPMVWLLLLLLLLMAIALVGLSGLLLVLVSYRSTSYAVQVVERQSPLLAPKHLTAYQAN